MYNQSLRKSLLPDVVCNIILQYSCYSFCIHCNIFMFVEDVLLCGKCYNSFCHNCAKKYIRTKWHNCISIPKCICCNCKDNEQLINPLSNDHYIPLSSYLMKNNYKFCHWFEKERIFLLPIVRLLEKIIKNYNNLL